MKTLIIIALLPLIVLGSDNKKGFVSNPNHSGPIYTGTEGKANPYTNPHNQWGPQQGYPAPYYPQPQGKKDDCTLF